MKRARAALCVGIAIFQAACTVESLNPHPAKGISDLSVVASLKPNLNFQVVVVDELGKGVSGATVQLGVRPGVPFSGNVLKTDARGMVEAGAAELWARDWNEIPVTVEAPGFIRSTVYGISREENRIVLSRARSMGKTELIGKTTGYGRLSSNGTLDVSLVFPSVLEKDLGRLELTSLIGAGVDRVSVYGQDLELPENLSVPQQTETFMGFIPVTLDKLQYRVRFPFEGDLGVSAVRAQFDFKKTVGDLRDGKSFFDIINRFQFRSMATRNLALKPGVQAIDLPIDETKLVPKIAVLGAGIPKGYAMIAIAAQGKGGRFSVSDVKRLLPGEKQTLMTVDRPSAAIDTVRVVRSLKKYQPSRTDFSGYDYEEMSSVVSPMTFSPATASAPTVQFLEFLKPVTTSGRSVHLDAPTAAGGVTIVKGRLLLSAVKPVSSGSLWLVEKAPIWEFRFRGARSRIDLPSFGSDPWASKGRYRWEHEYVGHDVVAPSNELTHHVRTAVDFVVQ